MYVHMTHDTDIGTDSWVLSHQTALFLVLVLDSK